MFKNLLLRFTSKGKLLKNIKNDNYKNWENHFNDFNSSATKKANPLKLKSLGLEIYEGNLKEMISDYSITDYEKEDLAKIKTYFELSDISINAIKARYGEKTVDNLSKQMLADNQLTNEEVNELKLLANELNLSDEDLKRINQKNAIELYENALRNVVSDQMVTFQEQEQLENLARQLGINTEQINLDNKLSEIYSYLVLLNALDHGYLPRVNSPSIILQKNEIAHLEISASLLDHKVITTGYSSASRGVSIRIMKGVSYRVGASRSTPIKEEVSIKYSGVLEITSKRVVFAASQKSFSIPYSQLISFNPYSDGIGFQKSNKEMVLQFNDHKISEVVFKILSNAINQQN
jgi:hypothetical protein